MTALIKALREEWTNRLDIRPTEDKADLLVEVGLVEGVC